MRALLPFLLLGSVRCGVYDAPHTLPDRPTLVQLFEWRWVDVAAECEDFLQHWGYGAVQVSPPQEHVVLSQNGDRPWWIRYQPVSYRLESRSGTRAQFIDMVQRCNAVGVRIIVDAVLNHMTGSGVVSGLNGVSSSANSTFRGVGGSEQFPGVPYMDTALFHDYLCAGCGNHCSIPDHAYADNAWQVRNCRLVGLLDLDHSNEFVASKVAAYLNDLIDIGVAGFRVDAEKHMWPKDAQYIYSKLHSLNATIFGRDARPFIVGEVTGTPGAQSVTGADYTACCGRVTNFQFVAEVQGAISGAKNWRDLANFGPATNFGWAGNDVLNFVDNHDTQRSGGLSYKAGPEYTLGASFLLASGYGLPRVMSSYAFTDRDQGPPSTGAPHFLTTPPTFAADKTCEASSGWICEHRWVAIRRMALFRSVTQDAAMVGISATDGGLAFERKGKGFFAVNSGPGNWVQRFSTALPDGTYCDILTGDKLPFGCTGMPVFVNAGSFRLIIQPGTSVAIHTGQMIRY